MNRPLRVRINCPATGYIRTVEVLGTAADTAANRCLITAYPFPAADTDMMTRPNYDGPVRMLPQRRDGDQRRSSSSSRTGRPMPSSRAVAQTIADAGDDHGHAQRQIQDGDGQWRRQNSAPVAAASASSRWSSRWAC